VVLRYAHGIDRRDWACVAACFTAHAHADYGAFYRGEIDGCIEMMKAGLARFASTMHLIGNHLIELTGDRATGETYAVAYHRDASATPPRDLITGVRYLDDLERSDDGRWRIARRVVAYEWRRDDATQD
jgi:hypothetical protein